MATGGATIAGSAASASESTAVVANTDDSIPEGATVQQSYLACDQFTGKVLKYAQAHGYCPKPGDEVAPNAVQSYNCGSSWIYVYNYGYAGELWVSHGFNSTLGTVAYRNIAIGTSEGPGWQDAEWMWSTYYDTEDYVGYYWSGWKSATMSGTVQLAWGGYCVIPTITDSAYI